MPVALLNIARSDRRSQNSDISGRCSWVTAGRVFSLKMNNPSARHVWVMFSGVNG
jgi:hypothetical protein